MARAAHGTAAAFSARFGELEIENRFSSLWASGWWKGAAEKRARRDCASPLNLFFGLAACNPCLADKAASQSQSHRALRHRRRHHRPGGRDPAGNLCGQCSGPLHSSGSHPRIAANPLLSAEASDHATDLPTFSSGQSFTDPPGFDSTEQRKVTKEKMPASEDLIHLWSLEAHSHHTARLICLVSLLSSLGQSSTAMNRPGEAPPFLISRGRMIIFTRFFEIRSQSTKHLQPAMTFLIRAP